MKKKFRSFIPYIILISFLSAISFVVRGSFQDAGHFLKDADFQLFILGGMIFVGYYINRIAPKTIVPSFVWAIFAGIALQPFLSFFTDDIESLKIMMEVFGAIILFAGGLEIPFRNFQKWFVPIATLSLVGVIFTSIGFAFVMFWIMNLIGEFDAALIPSILILSAALSSTDPTAIIPTLNMLRFKKPELKQIAISESALTDVSGSILTRFLLLALITAPAINKGVFNYFGPLLQKSTYDAFALQIISGIIVGYFGFFLIKKFYYNQERHEESSDPALLLSIPIFTFVLGNVLGGAGFLAAFTSGLLTDAYGAVKKVSHFYESLLNHLIKPFIFIILGALVPLSTLIKLAPIGIGVALIFMFVLRPIVVFISLAPWWMQNIFKLKDLLFLSFIRETGIIAAILLVIAATFDIIQSEFVIAIGMWVILMTLIIEPPLTPWLAKKIGVAKEI
ncbi:MAG: cation:proton antiporter [Candidatus Roizmanbacteria bacterium]|nr:cation:proton antiporter [Candidatus Roizmanbacteria bacterium]